MVQLRDDVVGLDAAILSPPAVWEASGHLANFTDPLVDCSNCHERWRADKIDDVCPNCGSHDLTEARPSTSCSRPTPDRSRTRATVAYLRPETAQGMFVNFANVLTTTRKKPPFGIAQVGKSFRNEITPRNFVFRTREFEQMEMEFFVPPDEAQKWFEYWLAERMQWYLDLGMPADKLRLRHHDPTSCRTTRAAPPTWSSSSPGAGTSSRASPTGVTTTSWRTPPTRASRSTTSTSRPTSATSPT